MATITLYPIDGTPDRWIKWAANVLKAAARHEFLLHGAEINGGTLIFTAHTDGLPSFPLPTIARIDVTSFDPQRFQAMIDYAPRAEPIINQFMAAVSARWPDCRVIEDEPPARVSDQRYVLPGWVQSLDLSARDQDFVRLWNEYPTVKDLANHLSRTTRTVSNRASELRNAHPELLPLLPYRGNLKTR